MNERKKKLLMILSFILVIGLGIGVSFAFFNYTRTGPSNVIGIGGIDFASSTTTINLSNIFPIDRNSVNSSPNNVGTSIIDISGFTTYEEGIEYLVTAVDVDNTINGKQVPISIVVTPSDIGTEDNYYFTDREGSSESIYKVLSKNGISDETNLVVGYIKSGETGINGTITIKAYIDTDRIGISRTYDGTESYQMGTENSWVNGRVILTPDEWNTINSQGISFKIKVEANEGIWVKQSLDDIIRVKNLNTTTNQPVMDNVASEFVTASTGINFGAVSSDTNGKGVYMRAGTENDAYPIVYYRGAVTDNNVVFNNICWKAVRTTDTGGIKLIYNGEVGNVYEEIPLTETQYTIPSGATNNFIFNSTDNSWEITITDNTAKEISFTVPAGNGYKIVQTGTSGLSTGGTWTFYKDGISVKSFGNGGGDPMNDTYSFGTLTASNVIKWTYVGSSSVESPITFKLQMLQLGSLIAENVCENTGINTQIDLSGTNMFAFNTSNISPAYVGYMYGDVYTCLEEEAVSGAYYGSGFTYSNGLYTLTNASTTIDATHHYTCNLTTSDGTCATIRYYYYNNPVTHHYVNLTGGDSIEEAMAKMQTNTTNSNAKDNIDTWYASNMTGVTNKLEDTIWCNDRSMGNGNNNGWIANGGDLSTYLYYGAYQRSNYASNSSTVKNQPSLKCTNKNDAFTVRNGNGNRKLTYPVALLTEDEIVLAGGLADSSSTFYLNNGSSYYWSLSPSVFNIRFVYATEFYVHDGGIIYESPLNAASGIRPAISIKPGLPVIKGTGTSTDPYVVE